MVYGNFLEKIWSLQMFFRILRAVKGLLNHCHCLSLGSNHFIGHQNFQKAWKALIFLKSSTSVCYLCWSLVSSPPQLSTVLWVIEQVSLLHKADCCWTLVLVSYHGLTGTKMKDWSANLIKSQVRRSTRLVFRLSEGSPWAAFDYRAPPCG
jgi:hypothetical protein